MYAIQTIQSMTEIGLEITETWLLLRFPYMQQIKIWKISPPIYQIYGVMTFGWSSTEHKSLSVHHPA